MQKLMPDVSKTVAAAFDMQKLMPALSELSAALWPVSPSLPTSVVQPWVERLLSDAQVWPQLTGIAVRLVETDTPSQIAEDIRHLADGIRSAQVPAEQVSESIDEQNRLSAEVAVFAVLICIALAVGYRQVEALLAGTVTGAAILLDLLQVAISKAPPVEGALELLSLLSVAEWIKSQLRRQEDSPSGEEPP